MHVAQRNRDAIAAQVSARAGCEAGGLIDDLASQLPGPLGQALADAKPQQAESFGIEEFYRRVAERIGARPRTAEWDASAVLTALAEAVSGGELNQILGRLPSGYALLFGKADLAG